MGLKKVLIVDDEVIPRQDLKDIVDWSSLGYEIVGEASNGEQALKLVHEIEPDVLITDIKMPVMDGIELIRNIRDSGNQLKVVILSCYEEFGYVKEAMRMGAIDYLVKHAFEEEDIKRVIKKLDVAFNNENIIAGSISLIKQDALKKLVKGIASKNELEGYISKGVVRLTGKRFATAVLSIRNINGEICQNIDDEIGEGIKTSIEDFLKQQNISGELIFCYSNEFAVILEFDNIFSENTINDRLVYLCKAINNLNKSCSQIVFSIGVSQVHSGLEKIADTYREAKKALEYSLYFGRERMIFYKQILPYNYTGTYNLAREYKNLIIDNIDRCNFSQLEILLKKIFKEALIFPRNINYIKTIYLELVSIIKSEAEAKLTEPSTIFQNDSVSRDLPDKFQSVRDMEEWFIDAFERLIDEIYDRNRYSKKISLAIEYVKKNYTRDISLKQIADSIGLSRIYLSQLFKKETGKNISDYLLEYRLEKAKELLRSTDLKIYEIAEKVGFQSSQHFSSMFKKYTGKGALDFKNTI